jgi:hypothetical protein
VLFATFMLFVSSCSTPSASAQATDACTTLIPKTLQSAVAGAYPGSRLVRESDYAADDIASELQYRKGNRCLGAASADVNGDRRADFMVVITRDRNTLIIAAVATTDGRWKVSTLETWKGDAIPSGTFANTLPPDKYTDMFAADDAPDEYRPEPGRVRRYTSRRPGFVTGRLGSTAVAYFYTGTRWVHLWLSD